MKKKIEKPIKVGKKAKEESPDPEIEKAIEEERERKLARK